MKKYLFLLFFLISTPVYAEDFITALGAECAKIIYNHSNWQYPTNYKMENSNNKQFDYLAKCLFLYKDNGGNIETLNKLYEKAKILENKYYIRCSVNVYKNGGASEEEQSCKNNKESIWENVIRGKECDLYSDNENIFFINDFLSHCKKD